MILILSFARHPNRIILSFVVVFSTQNFSIDDGGDEKTMNVKPLKLRRLLIESVRLNAPFKRKFLF